MVSSISYNPYGAGISPPSSWTSGVGGFLGGGSQLVPDAAAYAGLSGSAGFLGSSTMGSRALLNNVARFANSPQTMGAPTTLGIGAVSQGPWFAAMASACMMVRGSGAVLPTAVYVPQHAAFVPQVAPAPAMSTDVGSPAEAAPAPQTAAQTAEAEKAKPPKTDDEISKLTSSKNYEVDDARRIVETAKKAATGTDGKFDRKRFDEMLEKAPPYPKKSEAPKPEAEEGKRHGKKKAPEKTPDQKFEEDKKAWMQKFGDWYARHIQKIDADKRDASEVRDQFVKDAFGKSDYLELTPAGVEEGTTPQGDGHTRVYDRFTFTPSGEKSKREGEKVAAATDGQRYIVRDGNVWRRKESDEKYHEIEGVKYRDGRLYTDEGKVDPSENVAGLLERLQSAGGEYGARQSSRKVAEAEQKAERVAKAEKQLGGVFGADKVTYQYEDGVLNMNCDEAKRGDVMTALKANEKKISGILGELPTGTKISVGGGAAFEAKDGASAYNGIKEALAPKVEAAEGASGEKNRALQELKKAEDGVFSAAKALQKARGEKGGTALTELEAFKKAHADYRKAIDESKKVDPGNKALAKREEAYANLDKIRFDGKMNVPQQPPASDLEFAEKPAPKPAEARKPAKSKKAAPRKGTPGVKDAGRVTKGEPHAEAESVSDGTAVAQSEPLESCDPTTTDCPPATT